MNAPFDINDIQPTMRHTVMWLRQMGMNTTDSGDGVLNIAAGMECALAIPHVFSTVSPLHMLLAAESIWQAVIELGLNKFEGVSVESTYCPKDKRAIIAVYGINDELLAAHGVLVER